MSETSVRSGRLQVDPERCEGHARCLHDAPDVFGYDDVTNRAFPLPEADLQANRDAIEMAIRGCPEAAISWVAEKDGDG